MNINITSDQIEGKWPKESCIFAAVDSGYFLEHSHAFIQSSRASKKPVHLHVINPTKDVIKATKYFELKIDKEVTYTFNHLDLPNDDEKKRCIYAGLRFHILPHLLDHVEKVMILDIDSMILKDFDFPDTPCGVFSKKPEKGNAWHTEGTLVNASAVYFTREYINQTRDLIKIMNSLPLMWYYDQVAIKRLIDTFNPEDITHFNSKFLDWDFNKGSTIWTGKGKRKFSNPKYVSLKKSFDKLINQ